jgi:hypothetical protein
MAAKIPGDSFTQNLLQALDFMEKEWIYRRLNPWRLPITITFGPHGYFLSLFIF